MALKTEDEMRTIANQSVEFIEYTLTPHQEKQWINTRAMLLWQAPGFAHIFMSMMSAKSGDMRPMWSKSVEIAATDGKMIILNPDTFFQDKLPQRAATLAHEIIHGILHHCGAAWMCAQRDEVVVSPGVTLPYDAMTSNIAQDYVVNDAIVKSKIGAIDKTWLHDTSIATQDTPWQQAYAVVYKKPQKMPAGKKRKDDHLKPGQGQGKDPSQAIAEREQEAQQWQQVIAQAAAITRENVGRGNGSADQLKFLEQFLVPVNSWTDLVFGALARKTGAGGYDYRRADRRLICRGIFAPSRSGHGADTIVVVGDSSGSIFAVKRLIERFFAEMSGMLADIKPRRIILMWCDTSIKQVDYIDDEMDLAAAKFKGVKGGGGTSFVHPFQWLAKQGLGEDDIDAVLYLTDGDGTFPKEAPPYPVIWCDISQNAKKYPWGEVVHIPIDGTA